MCSPAPDSAAKMKSPNELAAKLAKQWQSADVRVARLLQAYSWPLSLPIGKPSARAFTDETELVRQHVQRWRELQVGKVVWQDVVYRAGRAPVELPLSWELRTPSEWVAATGDTEIQAEYGVLGQMVQAVDPRFHALILRQRRLAVDRAVGEVAKASEVALALTPGFAGGRPLRALTVCNIDSKFIERNRALLIQMLDVRFDGLASELGLESFLNAADDSDHWLLLVPLASGLLPFRQQRVRVSELSLFPEAVRHILIVENERCLHQLPELADTVAILGAGLNLGWMQAEWLAHRRVAYWGDMDTWGLTMLARARQALSGVAAVQMDRACFDQYAAALAVAEPVPASAETPNGLTVAEGSFYQYLHGQERGRLEQEFLPPEAVAAALRAWHGGWQG
ncbi:Wadjet anti-phage system protein JetD domain-containing protein [Cupriavidus pinatubonensis]|uniref:Wadjet anti-phage system protein JetD domain-containing protein n=1 Tax=Cupriavidus pinatubonensis TaxID=248026 RepID=UPI002159D009|nr:Wadjet anti-phage system protein JetD domain-containing protein [Cupriavidus pinatubonensis]